MKIGDLITTYFKGYYRLTKIEKRYITQELKNSNVYKDSNIGDEYSPLYHFVQIYDSNGNPKKSKEKQCDALFCNKAENYIKDAIKSNLDKNKKLQNVLDYEKSKI